MFIVSETHFFCHIFFISLIVLDLQAKFQPLCNMLLNKIVCTIKKKKRKAKTAYNCFTPLVSCLPCHGADSRGSPLPRAPAATLPGSGGCVVLSYVRLFPTPWTMAHQAPLSMEFFHARILEQVAISFFRGSSRPWNQTSISCIS